MKKKSICDFLFIGLVVFSLILLFFGIIENIHNISLIGVLSLYILCLYNCFKDIRNNLFLILFYLVIFVFILSRPTISFLRGDVWYYFSNESINWSMITISLSLLSLLGGKYLFGYFYRKKVDNYVKKENRIISFIKDNKGIITKFVFIIFVITAIISCFGEIDKLLFMRGKAYEEYYISYVSNLPTVCTYISALFVPILMILLCLRPRKLYCFSSLVIFLLLQIPMLIIGERGSIIKAMIFILLYLAVYFGYERVKEFLTLKKIIGILISVFVIIVFLGSYNYLRSDEKIENYNPFILFIDFFYRQGTSYDTINNGYVYRDKLPNKEKKNYTFGPIIDSLNNNIIIHKIFDTKIISEENSIDAALNSNNLSHALTYTVRKDDYLKGHGMGSSYLIETYIDYGYIGVIIFSVLIGGLLSYMPHVLCNSSFLSLLCLYIIREIYVVPRAETLSPIKFIFRASFWTSLLIVFIVLIIIYNLVKNKRKKEEYIAIIDNDITIMGGVEKVTEQLANKLCNKYKIIIISLNKTNSDIPFSFDKKVKIVFSSEKKVGRLREIIKNNRSNLSKIFKLYNIKLAICMGHYATFVSIIDKKFVETKIINCDHGALINQLDDKVTTYIRRFNYIFSTHTVALTNKNKQDYLTLFNAADSKISVIYNSINSDLITKGKKVKYNIKSNKIVTIGRMSPEKGFDMLVKIAKKLKEITDVEWYWDVYGDGPLKEEILKSIKENNLEKYVKLKGQNNNVIDLLNDYSLYVLPSYREGLPIVLLEAKVLKLPIVSFNVDTGPNEIVEDNKNGYLVEMYDINMMAEKIKELLENKKIRKMFSDSSGNGLEKFNEKKIVREWISLIEKIKKE